MQPRYPLAALRLGDGHLVQHDSLARPAEAESVKPLDVFRPSRLTARIDLAMTHQP